MDEEMLEALPEEQTQQQQQQPQSQTQSQPQTQQPPKNLSGVRPPGLDDDDEVVEEMDLLINPEDSKNLYLLQYLTKIWLRVPDQEIKEVRLKPRHFNLEFTLEPDGYDDPDRNDGSWQLENGTKPAVKLTSKLVPLTSSTFVMTRHQSNMQA